MCSFSLPQAASALSPSSSAVCAPRREGLRGFTFILQVSTDQADAGSTASLAAFLILPTLAPLDAASHSELEGCLLF